MNVKRVFILGIVLLMTFPVFSQEVWTLQRCIDYATENNINVRQRALEQEAQKLKVSTARWSQAPGLDAGLGQSFYFGRGPGRDGTYQDQTQASSSLNVNLSLSLFSGLRTRNQIEVNRLDLQATMEEYNKAKEDLALNITAYFLQVLFNKELYRIAEDQVALSKDQVEKTEILVKGGKSPESELYDARAALAKEELNMTTSANTLKLSLLDLSQLLNLGSVDNFDVEIPDVKEMVLNQGLYLMKPAEVFESSVNSRPAIKAAEFRLQSSERNLRVAKADFYPSLSLGASYNNSYYHSYNLPDGSTNTSFSNQLSKNGSESVGLNLNIPIFSRMATRNQVRSARISIESQQLALDEAKQVLYKEIQQAYYNASAAYEKFRSSEKSVAASQIAFQYEQQKYNAGRSTSYQFNDTKNRLAKSLSEVAQAKYDFLFCSKILDFYNGQPLY